MFWATQGYWNDLDFLMVGYKELKRWEVPQTLEEYRSQYSLFAILAAPLIFSADIRGTQNGTYVGHNGVHHSTDNGWTVELEAILLNRAVIAVSQDALGRQGRLTKNRNVTAAANTTWLQIYARELSGERLAVAVLNRGSVHASAPIAVTWTADIGSDMMPAGRRVSSVRDLWRNKQVAISSGGDGFVLAGGLLAHDTALFLLETTTAAPQRPQRSTLAAGAGGNAGAAAAAGSVAHITTTSAMRDASGAAITDCLEPHIQRFGDTYYAYGLTIRNASEQFACTIYSSRDLTAWTKRAYIPVNKTLDGSIPGDAVRHWTLLPIAFTTTPPRPHKRHTSVGRGPNVIGWPARCSCGTWSTTTRLSCIWATERTTANGSTSSRPATRSGPSSTSTASPRCTRTPASAPASESPPLLLPPLDAVPMR